MAVLLDTHALVWWLLQPDRLSKAAFKAIETSDDVYVSPVSVYEIDAKRDRDRGLARMPHNMPGALPMLGFVWAQVAAEAAWDAARLPWRRRDPWDRLLVAQARLLDVALVSADDQLSAYDVELIR